MRRNGRKIPGRRLAGYFITIGMLLVGQLLNNPAWGAQPLHIAVAANFATPARQIAENFERQFAIPAVVTVASSGTLFVQITHGAPFDVFMSADARRPEQLVEEHQANRDTLHVYAQGRLAYLNADIVAPDMNDLVNTVIAGKRKLAIANPALAPYGLAARQVLTRLHKWPRAERHLVLGKNVLQTYQYYRSGNVEHALVAASLVQPGQPHTALVPAHLHQPILQKVVVPATAPQPEQAQLFVNYLMSAQVQQQLNQWGYDSYSLNKESH